MTRAADATLPASTRAAFAWPALFAATIFLSAFLLFQVQPMIGKSMLPWFGGTPAVWSTLMLVFQVLLTGGKSSGSRLRRPACRGAATCATT